MPDLTRLGNTITCIQGAHRSKNYPAAIGFLERLSAKSECDVDVIVPTPTQRNLIEAVRNPSFTRLHVDDSLTEDRKVALQRNARAIAHLSLDEGYGIPLAEALYLYRPIICVDNAVNRELLSGCEDPLAAGVLLLKDPKLASERELQATADFVRNVRTASYHEQRRWIVDRLMAQQREAPARARTALESAASEFESWHARAGMGLVAPTELGGCGVSDYCLALTRSDTPRYVVLLGPAPRELQLAQSLRLVPIAALDELRGRTPGLVFNLAVSDSLTRGFDAIADGSSAADVLVIHDAGSYLPGLLMQASAKGDERLLFERYLRDEPDQVRKLARAWLADPEQDIGHNGHLFLDLDRAFRSNWLRSFRGRLISHHAAFSDDVRDRAAILALLSSDSEIRRRAEYVPMPIDARVTPGALRFAGKMRWALGLSRHDLLVCCAGSVVRGKHLDVVARVCAGLDERARPPGVSGSVTLLLAGRVLDDPLFAEMRGIFASAGAPNRIVQIVETSEARYDALLLASDVVVAFREQRRIQMSHSYVRALALGRPMVTNSGAGFDDGDAAAICNDEHLEGDLERHLLRLWERSALRFALSESSQKAFRARHTVTGFFEQCERASDVTSLV